MFDKLIDSAPERRKRRFIGFFFGTSILYLLALTAALVVSVLITNPELAHTSDMKVTSLVPPPKRGTPDTPSAKEQASKQTRPDIYHPVPLDEAVNKVAEEPTPDRTDNPPTSARIDGSGHHDGVDKGDPNSPVFIPGMGPERRSVSPDPIEPPPPPPTTTAKQPKNDDPSMIKVPSKVLQGKAIERRTPAYPRMAILTKIVGSVSVEVVISPDGRVEVARAISGHPLLKPSAVEAARLWRFQPTLLNGTPVRVTGIITFVFKLD